MCHFGHILMYHLFGAFRHLQVFPNPFTLSKWHAKWLGWKLQTVISLHWNDSDWRKSCPCTWISTSYFVVFLFFFSNAWVVSTHAYFRNIHANVKQRSIKCEKKMQCYILLPFLKCFELLIPDVSTFCTQYSIKNISVHEKKKAL